MLITHMKSGHHVHKISFKINPDLPKAYWLIFVIYSTTEFTAAVHYKGKGLIVWSFIPTSTSFWSYLGSQSTNQKINNFSVHDQLLPVLHMISISAERDKLPLDSMSEINCHREISPCLKINPATPG